jgi:pimeloyl-ACP methyl ester carboxylesterase
MAATAAPSLKSTPLTTAAGFLPGLRRYDVYQTLKSIAARSVVVSGGTDILTPTAHALDLVAGIAGATHLHLPTAGHMLLHEAPRVVYAAINRAICPPMAGCPTASGRTVGRNRACDPRSTALEAI